MSAAFFRNSSKRRGSFNLPATKTAKEGSQGKVVGKDKQGEVTVIEKEETATGRLVLQMLVPRITSDSELPTLGRWACPVSTPEYLIASRIAKILTKEGIRAWAPTGGPASPGRDRDTWEIQRTLASCEPGENETWHGIAVQSPPVSGDAQELASLGDVCVTLASEVCVRLDDLRCLVDVEVADLWAVKRLIVLLWFVEPLLLRLCRLRCAFLPLATHSTAALKRSTRPTGASTVCRVLPARTRAKTVTQLQQIWDANQVDELRSLVSLPGHGEEESFYITSEHSVTFKHLPSTLDPDLVPRWMQLCLWIAQAAQRGGEFPEFLGRIRRSESYGPLDLITDLGGASAEVFRFWYHPY